jgi:putative transposase
VVKVPWTGFDLINAFNAWKRSESAGRRFIVDTDGNAEVEVTGLAWRTEISAQVFEEAVVDLGKALKAWTDSRRGKRAGRAVGHPRFKKKNTARGSFRMRNKISTTRSGKRSTIRVGEAGPRSVTLPGIGVIKVHDDTRRLRRMLAGGRARILFATVSRRGGRWRISLNVEAADLHPPPDTRSARPATTAAGRESIAACTPSWSPRPAMARRPSACLRRRKRCVSRALVQTHDRLVIEDLNIQGLLANHRLAAAISDAAWGELARQIRYKLAWRGGHVLTADRWFASSKTCSACGAEAGSPTPTDEKALARATTRAKLARMTWEPSPPPRHRDVREGRCRTLTRLSDTLYSMSSSSMPLVSGTNRWTKKNEARAASV